MLSDLLDCVLVDERCESLGFVGGQLDAIRAAALAAYVDKALYLSPVHCYVDAQEVGKCLLQPPLGGDFEDPVVERLMAPVPDEPKRQLLERTQAATNLVFVRCFASREVWRQFVARVFPGDLYEVGPTPPEDPLRPLVRMAVERHRRWLEEREAALFVEALGQSPQPAVLRG